MGQQPRRPHRHLAADRQLDQAVFGADEQRRQQPDTRARDGRGDERARAAGAHRDAPRQPEAVEPGEFGQPAEAVVIGKDRPRAQVDRGGVAPRQPAPRRIQAEPLLGQPLRQQARALRPAHTDGELGVAPGEADEFGLRLQLDPDTRHRRPQLRQRRGEDVGDHRFGRRDPDEFGTTAGPERGGGTLDHRELVAERFGQRGDARPVGGQPRPAGTAIDEPQPERRL